MSWLDTVLKEGEHSERLLNDLPYFCEHALRLRPKSGPLEAFKLNPAQLRLHELLEEQKRKTGRVRAIVLKARQLGVSTYVAARFFHRTVNNPGLRTIILGHERRASSNLFQIVKRYYDHLPEGMRPSVGTSNAEELIFDRIDSGYIVAVATGEGTGRSATAQMLHASETAFWPDLPLQMASLMQTVPDGEETEIILESTANGYNDFHSLWRNAETGKSEFLPIFLPWSSDPGYRRYVDADFKMDEEEATLAEMHDLDAEQIAWRRAKIGQLGTPELFPQEYPLIASEAFIRASFDGYIPAEIVTRARKEQGVESYGPLLIGVDPAHLGADRTSIAWRRGHRIEKVESRRNMNTMEVAGWVGRILADDKPSRVFIDVGGLGIGVYDRLLEQGHGRTIRAVNFGGKPIDPVPFGEDGEPAGGYANRRAEMYAGLKKALESETRFSLPDSNSLQADLVSVGYKFMSNGRLLLESKADMRKRGVPSPDEADAVALTFAEPTGFPRLANFNRRDLHERTGGLYV